MADQQHAAFELLKGVRQRLFAFHVQVVGGLIQHQQAVAGKRQAHEQQARAFAAAERADFLPMAGPGEPGADERHFAVLRIRCKRLQRVEQRGVIRQLMQRLVVVARRDARMDFQPAVRRFIGKMSPDKLHQRRFTAAVTTDNRHAIAAFQPRRFDVKQRR